MRRIIFILQGGLIFLTIVGLFAPSAFNISIIGVLVISIILIFLFNSYFKKNNEVDFDKSSKTEFGDYYKELIHTANIGFFRIDKKGRILESNGAFAYLLGYDVGFIVGKNIIDFVSAESRDILKENLKKRGNGEKTLYELPLINSKNELVYCLLSGTPIIQGRSVQESFALVQDISHKYINEEILKQNEQKYHGLFDALTIGVVLFDDELKIIDYNKAANEILKVDLKDFLGKTLEDFTKYSKKSNGENYKYEEFPAVVAFNTNQFVKDGEIIFQTDSGPLNLNVNAMSFVSNGKRSVAAVFENVTEKKLQEYELKQNKANLEGLINNTEDFIWSVDKDLNMIIANDKLKSVIAKSFSQELSSDRSNLYILPKYLAKKLKAGYERALAGERVTTMETRLPGMPKYLQVSFNPIYIEGQVYAVSCFAHDISKLKESEEKIYQSKQWLQNIIDSIEAIVFVTNNTGRFLLSNKSYKEFIRGIRNVGDIKTTKNILNSLEVIDKVLSSSESVVFEETVNLFGEKGIDYLITKIPLKNQEGEVSAIISHIVDISTQKLAERKLRKYSEELEVFNKTMIDRELRVVEMKKEVNKLLEEQGKNIRYEPIWE